MSRNHVTLAFVLTILLCLVVVVPAMGAGGPPPGGGGTGGGGGPGGGGGGPGGGGGGHDGGGDETATNNLSWPTVMLGTNTFGLTSQTLALPSGVPLTGYAIDPAAYWYVQGVHKWQCEWMQDITNVWTGTAEWGDNLAGSAPLRVGKPIRVELGLFDDPGSGPVAPSMQGFTVVKLEPSKLDRESAYGTLATADGAGGYYGTATPLAPARLFDDTVTFSVKSVATGAYVVPLNSNPTAEINATGRIVYGYNLRVSTAGAYEITFVIPKVDITGVDAGTFVSDPLGPDKVTLVINVTSGGGGGGRP